MAADKGISKCRGAAGSSSEEAERQAMRAALEASFIRTDDEILDRARREDGRDGACALIAVRIGGYLWTAHAGDSRAVLARGSHAVRLTEDHKPGLATEAQRVKAVGGRVEFQRCWRVISTARWGRRSLQHALHVLHDDTASNGDGQPVQGRTHRPGCVTELGRPGVQRADEVTRFPRASVHTTMKHVAAAADHPQHAAGS